MRRIVAALVLVLGLPLTVLACLWDRDTPASEAKGLPDVVAAITGRFERNPPLFYEMRLARVSEHLKTHPEDLSAYDDAGVACDRIGRGDEAITWMDKKREQLEKLDASRPEIKDHFYRYHANLGTFLVHRWVREGADRAKLDAVKKARDEIARAIEINPNAHFGREKYQLMVLDWIVDPPKAEKDHNLPIFLEFKTPHEAHEAVRGLSGLVVLGNTWESVDVFNALILALDQDSVPATGGGLQYEGRTHLAHLAHYRAEELIDSGKGSILPDAPTGSELKDELKHVYAMEDPALREGFQKLRAEADAWHEARTAYMMKQLSQGLHPDTDRAFWSGYRESPAPSLPGTSQGARNIQTQARMAWTGIAVLVAIVSLFLAVGLFIARLVHSRRKPAVVNEF